MANPPATAAATAVDARPLTEKGARTVTDKIKAASEEICALLVKAYEGRAWEVLGYNSWREYAATEFDMSESYAYRQLNLHGVLMAFSSAGSLVTSLPESHARELTPLLAAPEDAVDAYEVASADGAPTASKVRDAVTDKLADRINAADEDEKKPKKPVKPHDPVDDFDGTPPDVETVPDRVTTADTIVVFTRYADDLVDAIATEPWARVDQMVRPALRQIVEAMNSRARVEAAAKEKDKTKAASGTGKSKTKAVPSSSGSERTVEPRFRKT